MVINIKNGLSGGSEYLNQISGIAGNPIFLSIVIFLVFMLTLLFAMLLVQMGTNKWKLLALGCVLGIILIPVGVAGYEYCRKKSLDEKYMKSKQQFVAPPSQFFGRSQAAKVVEEKPIESEQDKLSDFGNIEDWFDS